jgi:alkylation response protein AidB-like acyl-CoA dehydrogenase
VRFALDEAAEALRDATAEVLRGYAPGGDGSGAWGKLAGVGVLGTLVPEERGGLGLDENALVPVLEEIGYSGLPGPAAETIAVAAPLLAEAGVWTADGDLVAVRAGDADLIPYGEQTPRLVMDCQVFERDQLVLEECPSVDPLRPLARVVEVRGAGIPLDPDRAGPGGLGEGPGGLGEGLGGLGDGAWQRGVLGTAALLCGLSRRMLDMTVEYVKKREQYGVPVGSFQAVKHALADALVAVEFARPAVLAAAWAQSQASESIAQSTRSSEGNHAIDLGGAARATSAAKVLASDAARLVARTAIQCHGAMGYTTEYDLHLFAKRVWALAPSWGGADWHRARIAASIGVLDG